MIIVRLFVGRDVAILHSFFSHSFRCARGFHLRSRLVLQTSLPTQPSVCWRALGALGFEF